MNRQLPAVSRLSKTAAADDLIKICEFKIKTFQHIEKVFP